MNWRFALRRVYVNVSRKVRKIFQILKESWIVNKVQWMVVGILTLGSLSPTLILIRIISSSVFIADKALYLPISVAIILSLYMFLKEGMRILKNIKNPLNPLERARLVFFSLILSFSISNAFIFGSQNFPLGENLFFYIQIFARNFVIWWIFLVHLVRVPTRSPFRLFTEGLMMMIFAIDWYLELWSIRFVPNAVSNIFLINMASLSSWCTWLYSVRNYFLFYLPFVGAMLLSINDVFFHVLRTLNAS